MVPPDSHGISGVPCYLGNNIHRHVLTVTGLSPSPAPPSKGLHLHTHFLTAHQAGRPNTVAPTTPQMQPLPGITHLRFSLIRFRSPLLSESLLFSLPMGTEMFHFPTFPPHALYIQAQVTGHDSSWVSPFGHPRITARLPTPQGLSQAPTSFIGSRCQGIHHVPFTACRHQHHTTPTDPPKDQPGATTTPAHDTPQKKLAPQPPPPPPTPYGASRTSVSVVVRRYKIHPPHTSSNYSRHGSADDARVHYPHLKQQPHTTHQPARADQRCGRDETTLPHHHTGRTADSSPADSSPGPTPGMGVRVRFQNPNSVSPPPATGHHPPSGGAAPEQPNTGRASTEFPLMNTTGATRRTPVTGCVLLRKEVIQPHLPVRLPCYDFVPIASPTFDHSLQQAGWAMGFGCCRLS